MWQRLIAANPIPNQPVQGSVGRLAARVKYHFMKCVRFLINANSALLCARNVFGSRFTASKEYLHERDAAKRDKHHGTDRRTRNIHFSD